MRLTEGLGLNDTDTSVRPTSFWRVSSRVEDHLLTGKNETIYVRIIFWALLAICTSYIVGFLRRPDLTDEVVWILHLKGYVIAAISNIALIYIYRRMMNYLYLGPGLKRLKLKLPDDSAVPIRMTITQQKAITGLDEGYLWFSDGTLFYKGRQTTFRLNREDVPAISLWNRKERPNLAMNRMPEILPIPNGNSDLKIKFSILDSHEDFTTRRQASQFYNSLILWLNDRPQGSLESLLPPTELHPGFRISDRNGREPLYAAIALTVTNIIVILSMNFGTSFRGSAVGFAVLCTLLHLVLLYFSVKLLREAHNTIRVRTELEKNPEIL